MTFFHFVILSLAVYRLSLMITKDAGPFGLFRQLRLHDGVFLCLFCVSVWVSAIACISYYFLVIRSPLVVVIGQIFAMSAIAVILDRTFTVDIAPK